MKTNKMPTRLYIRRFEDKGSHWFMVEEAPQDFFGEEDEISLGVYEKKEVINVRMKTILETKVIKEGE